MEIPSGHGKQRPKEYQRIDEALMRENKVPEIANGLLDFHLFA